MSWREDGATAYANELLAAEEHEGRDLRPLVDETSPADGMVCPECGRGFVVGALEHDGECFEDLDERWEAVAAFCPFCGTDLRGERR